MLGGFLVAGAASTAHPVIADVARSVVAEEQSGMAAGINETFRQVGIAVGIAAWGAIFLSRGASEVEQLRRERPRRPETPSAAHRAASSGYLDAATASIPAGARETVADAAGQASSPG